MSDTEREMWRSWWETATPEQREWARARSGQPFRAADVDEDAEGIPAGVWSTSGRFPNWAEMFDDFEEENRG